MKKIVLLLLIALPAAAFADGRALTIDQAVQAALDHNLSLDRSAVDLAAKKRQNDNAPWALLPGVSASASLARPNQAYNALGAETTPAWSQSLSYGASLSWTAGAFADIALAQTNYRNGLVAYADARRSLEKSVRAAFYALLLQAENVKLEEQTIARAQTQFDQASASHKAGLVPDLDVLSAQVSLESLKPQLDSLTASYEKQKGQFKQLLGIDPAEAIELAGAIDQFGRGAIDGEALAGGESAALQALRLNLAAAEQNKLAQQLAGYLPSLSVGWNAAPARSDVFGSPSAWKDSAGGLSVTLSYSLNAFFPWTAAGEAIAASDDQIKKYRSQIAEQAQTQALDRQNNLRQIRQSQKSLAALELNVSLAQKTYDLSLEAYKRGAKDLVSLQGAEGDLQKAKYNVLSERYTLLSSVLDLEYEENIPFGTLLGGNK